MLLVYDEYLNILIKIKVIVIKSIIVMMSELRIFCGIVLLGFLVFVELVVIELNLI